MSDTTSELKRARYLEENDLENCSECGCDVPSKEMTSDLGDDLCKDCHDSCSRTCILCGQVTGHWNGTETKGGFVCDDHRSHEPPAGFEDQLTDESRERAMDHIFKSEEDEQSFIEETREQLKNPL